MSKNKCLPLSSQYFLESLPVAIKPIIYAEWVLEGDNNVDIFPSSASTSVRLSIPAYISSCLSPLIVSYVTNLPSETRQEANLVRTLEAVQKRLFFALQQNSIYLGPLPFLDQGIVG